MQKIVVRKFILKNLVETMAEKESAAIRKKNVPKDMEQILDKVICPEESSNFRWTLWKRIFKEATLHELQF